MKRILTVIAACALACALAGCGQEESSVPADNPAAPEPSGEEVEVVTSGPELLSVLISNHGMWEWGDENVTLAEATWETLILSEDDAAAYPQLARALEAAEAEQNETMEVQMGFMIQEAQTYLEDEANAEYFGGFTSSSDYSIVRADELILSFREDVGDYMGGIHPMHGVLGRNYDPATGAELSLSDVSTDVDALVALAIAHLKEKYAEDLFDTASELLADRGDSWNWTMDYQGITFYFNPYELAPYAAGVLTVTVWFDEAPRLFVPEFMQVPESGYAMGLPLNTEVAVDLDPTDGKRDTLALTTPLVSESGHCGFSAILNDVVSAEGECYGYSFDCYLVRAAVAEGFRNYLYVESTSDNDYRSLYVYDLDADVPAEIGVLYGTGFWGVWFEDKGEYGTYYHEAMIDPAGFVLGTRMDVLSTMTGTKAYAVDASTGMPVSEDEAFALQEMTLPLVSVIPLEVTMLPGGESEVIEAGAEFAFLRTDGESYVDMKLNDGRECRIAFDASGYPRTINGVPEYDCFEMLYYAG